MKKSSLGRSQRSRRYLAAIEHGYLLKSEAARLLGMNKETFRKYYIDYVGRKRKRDLQSADFLDEIEELEELF